MTLTNLVSSFVAYIKQTWENSPSTASPLSADRLNYIEDGIQNNSDAIEAIANAVVDTITNDSDKIASLAAAYKLQSQITSLNSDHNMKSYTDVTQFGAAVSDDAESIYNAMAYNSELICDAGNLTGDGWNFPTTVGLLRVFRSYTGRGAIILYGKTGNDYRMFLSNDNVPTGTWATYTMTT